MVEGKTSTGFEYTVDGRILEDADLFRLMAYAMNADGVADQLKFVLVIDKVLGKEQAEKLYKHVRGPKSLERLTAEFGEIMGTLGTAPETKN